jgi:hypothetical protein
MANQDWVSCLTGGPHASGAGTALATAATATISATQAGALTADVAQIQAAPIGWQPGLLVRVTAQGFLTTTATSTTATIFLAANKGNAGSTYVTLATPVGITTGTTVITGIQWTLEAIVRCTAIASSGNTVSTQGRLVLGNSGAGVPANPIALTATPGMTLPLPNISGETAAAVDTTQLQGICCRATLVGANATIQLTQWIVEALD